MINFYQGDFHYFIYKCQSLILFDKYVAIVQYDIVSNKPSNSFGEILKTTVLEDKSNDQKLKKLQGDESRQGL